MDDARLNETPMPEVHGKLRAGKSARARACIRIADTIYRIVYRSIRERARAPARSPARTIVNYGSSGRTCGRYGYGISLSLPAQRKHRIFDIPGDRMETTIA